MLGSPVGFLVGFWYGDCDGTLVGLPVGSLVGLPEGV